MTTTKIICETFVILGASCGAMTRNDFDSVTNDWYHGAYSNVYALARYRESQNSNDVVAAYIQYEWNKILGTKETFSNAIDRVLVLSSQVTNVSFVSEYSLARENLVRMRDEVIPSVSEEQVESDWSKAKYTGKRFTKWRLLKILWDEHLW